MKAIVYVRVSSQEQVSNLSLPLQERTCRDYCEGQGVRTKGYADTLVVYSVSRLARDTYSHLAIKAHLARKGMSLRSVTEPLDDTATGKLMENILASMAQWYNDVRSERTTAGMQEAIRRGRWVWQAPLGYRNVVRPDGTKSIDPDERQAPLVVAAYELAATGLYSLGAIAERLHGRGLRGRRSGKALSAETLRKLLRNPAHAGRLQCRTWDVERVGDWTPIVERELWVRVQAVLGRMPSRAPYQSAHPDFPLRRFVRCGGCQPLTGSWTKGRNGRYAYYRCTSCNRSVATLEQDFAELLKGLRPEPELLKLWRAIVLDVWREHTARADTDRKQQR
ncbi:MAG TPA: recombinase family protein, partial [Thermoanaerobaculia bacterium]